MTRHGEERFDEMWQQSETLDNNTGIQWQAQQILDDEVETFALKPVERFEHGFRRSVHPSLIHVHVDELVQQRAVFA